MAYAERIYAAVVREGLIYKNSKYYYSLIFVNYIGDKNVNHKDIFLSKF